MKRYNMVIFYRKGFILDFIWQDQGIVQHNHIEEKVKSRAEITTSRK